jgi:type IV secretory pathway VirB4 component
MVDKHGIEIEDRIYNLRDFDRNLVLEKRTDLVARKISEFLKQTNRFDKTIVFCDSVDELRGIAPAVHRIFVDARAQVMEETLGNLSAFYAMFPGNGKFNVFPMWLAKDHHARLSICSPLKTGFVRR